jgi:membrane-associated phospholipid phosphatase
VTLGSAGTLAASGVALWAASALETGADHVGSCRWCEPGRLDRWARARLRWSDEGRAADASDLLFVAVPLGSAAAVGWLGARDGGPREALEDVLAVAAAVAIADPLTTGVKHASGRLRPEPWDAGGARSPGDLRSFVSGHTSRVFAASVAAAQVARLRGRRGWGWVAAIGLGAAATTGWLRTAADQHWATDVLGGAALGASVGWVVPAVALRPPGASRSGPRLAAAPGGLALTF